MARRDIHAEVTARILSAIEAGTRPWACDWLRSGPPQRVTGEAYRGVNTLLLALAAGEGGYTNPTWMTFKQAQALGGCVRKGERSTTIVFFTTLERQRPDANGQDVDVTVPCIRTYNVFNVEQIDGLPADRFAAPDLSALPAKQRDDAAESALRSSGAAIHEDGGNQAFYSRRDDAVHLPSFDRFQSVGGYLATLAHELVHWTGGKARLDRTFGQKFGDRDYAFEELVAEIGAAFVCARLNVAGDHIESHAAYVGHWVKAMRDDKRAIFRAASLAQAAADMVLANAGAADRVGASPAPTSPAAPRRTRPAAKPAATMQQAAFAF